MPEREVAPHEVAERLRAAYRRGKTHALVVVAEGAKNGAHELMEYFGAATANRSASTCASRASATWCAAASPTAADRVLATRLGAAAVDYARAAASTACWSGSSSDEVVCTPLAEIAGRTRPGRHRAARARARDGNLARLGLESGGGGSGERPRKAPRRRAGGPAGVRLREHARHRERVHEAQRRSGAGAQPGAAAQCTARLQAPADVLHRGGQRQRARRPGVPIGRRHDPHRRRRQRAVAGQSLHSRRPSFPEHGRARQPEIHDGHHHAREARPLQVLRRPGLARDAALQPADPRDRLRRRRRRAARGEQSRPPRRIRGIPERAARAGGLRAQAGRVRSARGAGVPGLHAPGFGPCALRACRRRAGRNGRGSPSRRPGKSHGAVAAGAAAGRCAAPLHSGVRSDLRGAARGAAAAPAWRGRQRRKGSGRGERHPRPPGARDARSG